MAEHPFWEGSEPLTVALDFNQTLILDSCLAHTNQYVSLYSTPRLIFTLCSVITIPTVSDELYSSPCLLITLAGICRPLEGLRQSNTKGIYLFADRVGWSFSAVSRRYAHMDFISSEGEMWRRGVCLDLLGPSIRESDGLSAGRGTCSIMARQSRNEDMVWFRPKHALSLTDALKGKLN